MGQGGYIEAHVDPLPEFLNNLDKLPLKKMPAS